MLAGPSLQLFLIILGTDSDNSIIGDQTLGDETPCGLVPPVTMFNRNAAGSSGIQTRMIVGGSDAKADAWPWQIAVLDRKKRLICGGTLINNEFVLTAAHCVTSNMSVVAGEVNLADSLSDERQERRVIKALRHPRYNKNNVDNDIALLKLETPLQLGVRVWPACLPEQDDELRSNVSATILGWGATSYLRQPDGRAQVERDDMLHEARVPTVDFDECKRSYGDDLKSRRVICAGYKEGRIDSCAGDSGGPLLVERNSKWYVYGVTSFGDECGKEGKYGIYSKTSAYVNWLRKTVNKFRSDRTTQSAPVASVVSSTMD